MPIGSFGFWRFPGTLVSTTCASTLTVPAGSGSSTRICPLFDVGRRVSRKEHPCQQRARDPQRLASLFDVRILEGLVQREAERRVFEGHPEAELDAGFAELLQLSRAGLGPGRHEAQGLAGNVIPEAAEREAEVAQRVWGGEQSGADRFATSLQGANPVFGRRSARGAKIQGAEAICQGIELLAEAERQYVLMLRQGKPLPSSHRFTRRSDLRKKGGSYPQILRW
jgi:hypothetical protein